jgi:hypothetical protein
MLVPTLRDANMLMDRALCSWCIVGKTLKGSNFPTKNATTEITTLKGLIFFKKENETCESHKDNIL